MFLRLDRALYLISTGLLWPVLATLTLLVGWSILLLGGFAQEWIARPRDRARVRPRIASMLRGDDALDALRADAGALPEIGFVPRYVRGCIAREGGVSQVAADKRIDDIEIEMAARLARLATVGRLGPMLGLAGTLIPLGPALVELAQGNIAALASQLVVAFSATIVGLLIGMLAIVCGQARRAWYAKDLSDIAYLEEIRAAAEERP